MEVSQSLNIHINDISCFLNCMTSGIIITLLILHYFNKGLAVVLILERISGLYMVYLNSMYNCIDITYLVL